MFWLWLSHIFDFISINLQKKKIKIKKLLCYYNSLTIFYYLLLWIFGLIVLFFLFKKCYKNPNTLKKKKCFCVFFFKYFRGFSFSTVNYAEFPIGGTRNIFWSSQLFTFRLFFFLENIFGLVNILKIFYIVP